MVNILYDTQEDLIIDLFVPSEHYDQQIRGEMSSMSRSSAYAGFELSEEIQEKQHEYRSDIAQTYKAEVTDSFQGAGFETSQLPLSAARASILNKTSIVNFALNNAKLQYPARGSTDVPSYFDFYTLGSGSYDCTNFVSHALLAGGAKQKSTTASGIQGNSYWYFRSSANRSSPWSSVNSLYSFMTTNTTANTLGGETFIYTLNGAYWGIGEEIYAGGEKRVINPYNN